MSATREKRKEKKRKEILMILTPLFVLVLPFLRAAAVGGGSLEAQ
jgi:hypothetical protein